MVHGPRVLALVLSYMMHVLHTDVHVLKPSRTQRRKTWLWIFIEGVNIQLLTWYFVWCSSEWEALVLITSLLLTHFHEHLHNNTQTLLMSLQVTEGLCRHQVMKNLVLLDHLTHRLAAGLLSGPVRSSRPAASERPHEPTKTRLWYSAPLFTVDTQKTKGSLSSVPSSVTTEDRTTVWRTSTAPAVE